MNVVVFHDTPEIETRPCSYCDKPTKFIGTRMCDNCWELMSRISADTVAAEKILAEVKKAISLREHFNNKKGEKNA